MFPCPRRLTPRRPFNFFFERRALPPPPPPPILPRRFATPAPASRKPSGPGFPHAPSPSDAIWSKKFVVKMCVTNLSILSTELLIAQRLRLKLADDQERMVAASELALGEHHEEIVKMWQKLLEFEEEKKKERREEIVKMLQKLIEFEEEKKKERESARMALDRKVAEKGKIVKDLGGSD